ncbi:inositol monophosphatase family protein [Corynebacterium phoceense]|uniref:inositol monophosphatase family protein n=1 Tax=Corynebacterium TaxID=1716 RepID=UPI000839B242|nr:MULTISPECIES: inositol monophosphatase family protein [Corynebacterium]MCQ9347029.1 inositol monophosphatase family protein [Corynebacterium phoceense]OFN39474.1 inositol-phosphate phosphatase [Corynebacterium sp. HMSC072G08]
MDNALSPVDMLAIAEATVDSVSPAFIDGLGARPARFKGEGDFATEVDLAIESELRQSLTQLTGIPVFGEETGAAAPGATYDRGAAEYAAASESAARSPHFLEQQEGADAARIKALTSGPVWVVDPIDGTANYAAGNPLCGVLVALLMEGKPVAAVADFPLLGRRVAAAEGAPLRSVGGPRGGFGGGPDALGFEDSRGHIGCSSHLSTGIYRHLRHTGLRPRMTGSVGLDTAFVAQGVFDGALNFSIHPWDNAAGALLVKAAGGIATDPEGNEWTALSRGLVVGTPQVHATLMDAIDKNRI